VILGGFLELESRSFWLDTIPEAFASETGTRKKLALNSVDVR
jgi:hypothetical protein